MLDGDKEHPLLDSCFPDVSGKGRGYQIQALSSGLVEWPELRKVSIWQTVGALGEVGRSAMRVSWCVMFYDGVGCDRVGWDGMGWDEKEWDWTGCDTESSLIH